jgi:hypothetical protein
MASDGMVKIRLGIYLYDRLRKMKNYLFLTDEGYCYDPLNKKIPNMQILGCAEGLNISEAFNNFKEDQSYLKKFSFRNVIALEIIGDFIKNLKL